MDKEELMKKAIERLFEDLLNGDNAEKEMVINEDITKTKNELIRNIRFLYQKSIGDNVPFEIKKQVLKFFTDLAINVEEIVINMEETF